MYWKCVTGMTFLLLLYACGIQAVFPTKVHPSGVPETKDVDAEREFKWLENGWNCPRVNDMTNISCSCDIPHTIRCRGSVVDPKEVLNLSRELKTTEVSLLDLTIHGITRLKPFSFDGLALLGLIISSAGLRTLSEESFKGLESQLAALGLPSNNLTAVPADALKVLRKLQKLDLSENSLKMLSSREFPTLLQLQNLNLAGNDIRTIKAEAFVRLPQLKALILSRNQLDASQINEKSLRGLHFLSNLSLKSNLIKGALTSSFLNSATKLETLDLSDNAITKVSIGALEKCERLRTLDLSYNNIDIIEDHAFKHLSRLEHLKISHNRIISVSGWSLAHLPKLVSLSLADNSLLAVTADLLHQLPSLSSLDLTANDISLLQPDVFNYTPSISSLSLADNPLHCECSITWLWAWLRSHQSLKEEDRYTAVCATPSDLENAPLVELNITDLTCSKEVPDYYHDEAEYEDSYELRMSDAEVSLQAASWVDEAVQLVWRVDERAVPYTCQAVHIYEMEEVEGSTHQILAEKLEVNCSSESQVNPHQVVVTVPGTLLRPGDVYRYCLVLFEHGTGDEGSFLPGCSEALLLTEPGSVTTAVPPKPKVTSLTAGNMGMSLVVQTRISGFISPCSYAVYVVSGRTIAASTELNCSEPRHAFSSLVPGEYVVCVEPDRENGSADIQGKLKTWSNVTELLVVTFPACTTVQLDDDSRSGWNSSPLFILLFTLPGLALIITLYIIGRRIWKGGGVPWRWDPRANKSAKYFLYTGETTTPTVSLDPLPTPVPESSV